MPTLYQMWLSPFCRKVRLALKEKGVEVEMVTESVWERRPWFLGLNPAGEVPVLHEDDGTVVAGSGVICEYLEENTPSPSLINGSPAQKAEIRRLVDWFDRKFNVEVTENLIGEKVLKRFLGLGTPSSEAIRAGKTNIKHHMEYITYLIERRSWLAGEHMSLADLSAAAHISCIDYIDDVPWGDYPEAKNWYARIKSRPSFRSLLAETVPAMPPPKHYADLDF
ncbi:MAG: glutathione S-transferase family protein [Alphaproteobacteria bacterium]|nr:glutathione S-transferase family protein [Rhodospirillales bacterium]MCW9044999.1 glutathione S-transferase family protein [Alphaproteobacteria bacterium]